MCGTTSPHALRRSLSPRVRPALTSRSSPPRLPHLIFTSALLAKELDDELGDRPVQVRVVQGKEPAHFRSMFKGNMIVRAGGKASGFKNKSDTDSYDVDGTELYHVKGSSPVNTYAVQIPEKVREREREGERERGSAALAFPPMRPSLVAHSSLIPYALSQATELNSGDVFVLLTPGKTTVWQGSGSNDAEKETAATIAEILKVGEITNVGEGGEPDDFWEALGGKAEYPKLREGEPEPADPRLFQCSNATGAFTMDEIINFAQDDLVDDDVMLLDCYRSVFLWIGHNANKDEKKVSIL